MAFNQPAASSEMNGGDVDDPNLATSCLLLGLGT